MNTQKRLWFLGKSISSLYFIKVRYLVCMKNKIFKFSILYFGVFIFAYWIWVYFSYLIIPFKVPPYNIEQREWPLNGYYKIKPGIYENIRYGIKYTINSKGFRTTEFNDTKSRLSRIIALGESSTMGMESGDSETWPSRLQQYLLADGFDVEVINCGIGGAISSHHLAMLRSELIGYKPDLILYYAGRNDHATFDLERYPGPYLYPQGRWHFFKTWVIYKKIQLRFIFLKWFNFDIEPLIPWPNNWMSIYRANLDAILKETEEAKIPFFIVMQMMDYPAKILEVLAENSQPQKMIIKKISMRNGDWHYFLRQLDLLEIQKKLIRSHNYSKFINLSEKFYEAKKMRRHIFYDNVHLTPEGNELIGRALAWQLETSLSLPKSNKENYHANRR